MSPPTVDPATLQKLVIAAFEGKDNAYAPYSKFSVGAALLAEGGDIILGCNVENASYGGTICAERTAITKAVSMGHRRFTACVVVSDIPEPTISPCGMCRQVLREFLPLNAPVYMISANYPSSEADAPSWLSDLQGEQARQMVTVMTMEELLPMSFGPDQLLMKE